MDLLKYFIVASDYFSRDDHRGGVVALGTRHYRSDGTEHTIERVPWKKLLRDIEKEIERRVPEDRRTDVFHKVMEGMPGRKKAPGWDRPVLNPHKKPQTPFSISRAVRIPL